MQLNHLFKVIGALIFLSTCVLSIPGFYDSFLHYWNSKGIWGAVFQVILQLLSFCFCLLGLFAPFADFDQWRTREQKLQAWFVLSTSLNLGFIPAFIIGNLWYDSWKHSHEHNILVAVFWLIMFFSGSIGMMRSTSTRRFEGLRLVKSA